MEIIIITLIIGATITAFVLIGCVYSAKENTKQQRHQLQIKQLEQSTRQALSMDQVRLKEIELDYQKIAAAGVLEAQTKGEQK